jgi:hypothetical protein
MLLRERFYVKWSHPLARRRGFAEMIGEKDEEFLLNGSEVHSPDTSRSYCTAI